MATARAWWGHFYSQTETKRGGRKARLSARGWAWGRDAHIVTSPHAGLTAYPLSLGVMNFELLTEEIIHRDLLLLGETVVFH